MAKRGRPPKPPGAKFITGLPKRVYDGMNQRIARGDHVCEMRHADAYRAVAHMLGHFGEPLPGTGHVYANEIKRRRREIDRREDGVLKPVLYQRLVDHLKKNRCRRGAAVASTKTVHGPLDKQCQNRFGFTMTEFIAHVEARFEPGMTWDRVLAGDVQIDHEIPVRCFDLSTPAGIRAAYALGNTKPMWRGDNARKGKTTDLDWIELFGDGCFRE